MSRSECAVCGNVFGSVIGFDKHRVGKFTMPDTRRCLTKKELKEIGLHQKPNGVWSLPAPIFSK